MLGSAVALLKRTLPAGLKTEVRRYSGRLRGMVFRKPLLCPVCSARVDAFTPLFQAMPALERELSEAGYPFLDAAETLNIAGYACPVCRASDRERLYALWIDEKLAAQASSARLKLIDFAPTGSFSRFLRARFDYRSADLFSPTADDRVDLQDMVIYGDGRFDAFLCSHVLEHVPDDKKAMRELFRILAPGGWGIAMVPINLRATTTDEDTGPIDDRERLRRFGQADHVRFYAANDFKDRLAAAGFVVEALGARAITKGDPTSYGIDPKSVLYVVSKPA